ncbi:MAG TPA: hypothetical protein VLC52_10755 [Anaerolineae bacterium]|nr:hypothetical protein [Anaerolineae bacterium]
MHIEMFPEHIIHAKCIGGDIDLICKRRVTGGFLRSAWRFADGESCIGRCVAIVDDSEYEALIANKDARPKTRLGGGHNPEHVENIERLTKRF